MKTRSPVHSRWTACVTAVLHKVQMQIFRQQTALQYLNSVKWAWTVLERLLPEMKWLHSRDMLLQSCSLWKCNTTCMFSVSSAASSSFNTGLTGIHTCRLSFLTHSQAQVWLFGELWRHLKVTWIWKQTNLHWDSTRNKLPCVFSQFIVVKRVFWGMQINPRAY